MSDSRAERAGFVPAGFRNPRDEHGFGDKSNVGVGFGQAGPSPSFPVGAGPGGGRPGQNRDKSTLPFLPLAGILGLALIALGASVARGGGGGTRSDAEVAAERQARRDRTLAGIAAIVAEFHALLPREMATAVGAIYARYSSRFQDSVADQVRAILADAVRKGVFVPLEHVFFDLAVRGYKSDRDGLNALRACIDRKAATVVFFFATNRLFRKTYKSLQFVEEQLVEKGVRGVFVRSGVDTAESGRWRQMLTHHAANDEFVVGMNVDNIRAAHEGLLARGQVFGTVTFGYAGEPVPGAVTRRGLPKRRLVVDPVAGEWVRTVFAWYATDGVTIAEVVRRLNADPAVPSPPRSPGKAWSYLAARKLLTNPRYRGCWQYGRTETKWVSSKDYARQVPRERPLREVQREDLRLVGDEVWHQAQARLATEVQRAARRPPRDGDRASRPRALDGLFVCAAHGRRMYAGGAYGKYLFCMDCKGQAADARPLFSHLPRALAMRRTCDALADLLRADTGLIDRVVVACREEAARLQAPDPAGVAALTARLARLDKKIAFLIRNPGDTDEDQAVTEVELRRVRKERADVQAELNAAAALASRAVAVPTEDEVRSVVDGMAAVLVAATGETGTADAAEVRDLVDLLTGGRVELEQAGERRAHRGWLVGRFRCPLVAAVTAKLGGRPVDGGDMTTVSVEYKADDGPDTATVAAVMALYDGGMLLKRIAAEVGLPRSAVRAMIERGLCDAGREVTDGRARRSALAVKHDDPPAYQAVADRVKELADGGTLFGDIAKELKLDRNTVTAAWKHWHESRGLPVLDGRARRKSLAVKSSVKPEGNNTPDH